MGNIVYKGRRVTVEEEIMPIKGKDSLVEKVVLPPVAVILPFIDKDTILLEKHYRPVIDKYLLELPGGKAEPGEKLEVTAERELEEETGYVAGKMEFLFKMYKSPGVITEVAYFFKATELKKTEQHLEDTEDIDLKPFKMDELLKMIKRNEIDDAEVIAGVLFCANLMR
jgi:ADP-ribose pyrophosphatase